MINYFESFVNLESCFNQCSSIINDIQKSRGQKIINIIMQHTKHYQDQYKYKFFELLMKKDMAGIIRILREIITNPNFKNDFLLLSDMVYDIDKENLNNIDKIIDCFFENCNKDSIEIIYEILGLISDALILMNDNDINKKFNLIRVKIIQIIKEQEKKMKERVKNMKEKKVKAKKVDDKEKKVKAKK